MKDIYTETRGKREIDHCLTQNVKIPSIVKIHVHEKQFMSHIFQEKNCKGIEF